MLYFISALFFCFSIYTSIFLADPLATILTLISGYAVFYSAFLTDLIDSGK